MKQMDEHCLDGLKNQVSLIDNYEYFKKNCFGKLLK
jgi:hypothetical protein